MSVTTSNTSVTVGVGSTAVVAATNRDMRQYLVLSNDSDATIYLAIDAPAVMNTGIMLPSGSMIVLDLADKVNSAINAISAAGSKNLCVFERYIDLP